MENENETDLEVDEEKTTSAEGEVNWEQRARALEEKAKASRENRKAMRDEYESKLAAKDAELKAFKEAQQNSQSNEPDYGKLALLHVKGIEHPDDIKIVETEAARLKLPYTDVLSMAHIQAQLTTNKEARVAKEGLPTGTGTGRGTSQNTVEYWLNKGEGHVPLTPDGNIDQELAEKVIEARVKKETTGSQYVAPH